MWRGVVVAFLFLAAAAAAAPPSVDLAAPGETLRVAIAGDAGEGAGPVAVGLARVHVRTPLDAILLPGDNLYPCGVKSATDPRWERLRPLSDLGIPLFPVLGNHDYCGNEAAQLGSPIPNWRFPAPTYAIRTRFADFAMIDTMPLASGWNEDALRAVPELLGPATRDPQPATPPWRIVVGHHLVLSSGYHNWFPRDERARMRRLLPVLRDAKVDLYICGHDHHLELLDGRPRFLVSGASSDPIPPIARHPNTLYPNEPTVFRGFAVVELGRDTMSVLFYDADGKQRGERFTFRH